MKSIGVVPPTEVVRRRKLFMVMASLVLCRSLGIKYRQILAVDKIK